MKLLYIAKRHTITSKILLYKKEYQEHKNVLNVSGRYYRKPNQHAFP